MHPRVQSRLPRYLVPCWAVQRVTVYRARRPEPLQVRRGAAVADTLGLLRLRVVAARFEPAAFRPYPAAARSIHPKADGCHLPHGRWPPDKLEWAMVQQQLRGKAVNEVVFDGKAVVAQLPHSIAAFFVPIGSEGEEEGNAAGYAAARQAARASHEDFLGAYQVTRDDVPLLLYDRLATRDPFSMSTEYFSGIDER